MKDLLADAYCYTVVGSLFIVKNLAGIAVLIAINMHHVAVQLATMSPTDAS